MKWLPNSIRWRIQLWHGLLLLAVLAAFGVTAFYFQRGHELRELDAELRMRLYAMHTQLTRGSDAPVSADGGGMGRGGDFGPGHGQGPGPGGGPRPEEAEFLGELLGVPMHDLAPPPPPEGGGGGPGGGLRGMRSLFEDSTPAFYFCIWHRDGRVMETSANAPAGLVMPQRAAVTQFQSRPGFRVAYDFTPPGECLFVGVSDAAFQAAMKRVAGQIIGYGGIVLALGLLGGWWMASRAIAPIRDISKTAQRIAEGDLHQRIPVGDSESELGQLTSLLNDTFARLAAVIDEQKRFTSDAAHELRTPLSVILAQTQLALSRQRGPEANVKTIEMAHRNATRMQELIESLLTLAKADAGAETDREPIRLDALSRDNLDHIRHLAEEKSIILHDDLPPTACQAHPGHVTQILTNLLGNAVKYCRPGDEVRVSTHRHNGHAILTVADTGPGIAPEHLPHLFERFYRADASRNRSTGGAGLGLAICKTLVEAQGGHITVESKLEKGTTFQVVLPVVKV